MLSNKIDDVNWGINALDLLMDYAREKKKNLIMRVKNDRRNRSRSRSRDKE